ncbi:hypothetical protein [Halobaculum sp. D14]|uniref:hypothetical protein n=1 Tax=Halobaculum sp. D14 TaxID=3421642 RepID=UPI003EBA7BBB
MTAASQLRTLLRVQSIEDITVWLVVTTGLLLVTYHETFPDPFWEELIAVLWLLYGVGRLGKRWEARLAAEQAGGADEST